jgi:hypothetical protein
MYNNLSLDNIASRKWNRMSEYYSLHAVSNCACSAYSVCLYNVYFEHCTQL